MAKVCEVCGKKPATGNNVSHSVRRTKRRFLPNLLVKRIWDSTLNIFTKKRLCSRCLRTSRKSLKTKASEISTNVA